MKMRQASKALCMRDFIAPQRSVGTGPFFRKADRAFGRHILECVLAYLCASTFYHVAADGRRAPGLPIRSQRLRLSFLNLGPGFRDDARDACATRACGVKCATADLFCWQTAAACSSL